MHDVHISPDYHDAVTCVFAEEVIAEFQNKMREAALIAEELRELLGSYGLSAGTMMPEQKAALARWVAQYNSSLALAGQISRDGYALLRRFTAGVKPHVPPAHTPSAKATGEEAAVPKTRPMPPPVKLANYRAGIADIMVQGRQAPPTVEHAWSRFPMRRVSAR
jgi:hypothetical protein